MYTARFPQRFRLSGILTAIYNEKYKWIGKYYVLITAALPLLAFAMNWIMIKIEPSHKNREQNLPVRQILFYATSLALIGMHWLSIADLMGYSVNMDIMGKILGGLLFVVVGNYLPIIRYNYSYGLKNPWTLESEKVWIKTHRMAGRVYMILGFFIFSLAFVPNKIAGFNMFPAILFPCILFPFIFIYTYSFFIYRKELMKGENVRAF